MKQLFLDSTNSIPTQVDQVKRRTLCALGGLAAVGIAGVNTASAMSASLDPNITKPEFAVAIRGMLVSKRDTNTETLVLRNVTDRKITVTQFYNNKIIFDGEAVDCNKACCHEAINIPPKQVVLVQFDTSEERATSTSVDGRIDLNKPLYHLWQGTRVVPFVASVTANGVVTLAEESIVHTA